jgi:undecaprenyl-diphosphatase
MDRPMRRHAILAALALAAFVWLMAAVAAGRTLPFDLQVRSRIHDIAANPLTTAMTIVTSFGSLRWIGFAAVAACVLLQREGHSRQALVVAVVLAGSIPIENGLKLLVRRQRPAAFFNVVEPATYSFPSGHAFFSTSFYGALGYVSARLARKRTQGAIIWLSAISSIVLICLSRVYLGVHYPTDVAGGVLIACFWMNAVLMFVKLR